ncbi:MAG: c-type cytochrome, partial [Pseudomonadota bacterium]
DGGAAGSVGMKMKPETLARLLILILVLGLGAAVAADRLNARQDAVELHARIAEDGGWTPDVIHVTAGQPLHLRLTSDDVMHSFAIGQSDQPAVDVLPGQVTNLTLIFDQPGTYTFYCTRWCGLNHWRMRGIIEVSGNDTKAIVPAGRPLYATLGLNIDAPHLAAAVPSGESSALRGAQFAGLLPGSQITTYQSPDYYRSHSPFQTYLDLRAEPALSHLTDANVWDLVAFIWQSNTTLDGLAEGRRLYAQNCAACHGETGAGDGVFAAEVQSAFGQAMSTMQAAGGAPANFTDPQTMLGASPALLQGKILRGGMGTGMPNWGPVFGDQQIWDLVAYLYTFQFQKEPK